MLESSDVLIVQAISNSGSISKAAELLNMSQPTLSKRLARLEHSLNIALFHRHNGGMKPTKAAQYLIEQGKSVQTQLNAIHRHIEMLANLQTGNLNIGVGPIIEQLYFPKVLLDFAEETHNIKVTLLTESAERLIDHLASGDLDIIIGPLTASELSNELIVTPVKSANLIFVGRAGHPLLETPGPISLDALTHYPSIGPSIPKSFRSRIPEILTPLITSENYTTSKSVVMFSDYITGGPELLFEKELQEGTLVELPVEINSVWTSFCAVKPESLEIPAVKKFMAVFDRYLDRG
ncbi:MAG: LysR family transcriptional regulator [Pseudomonadales bacterium]|nr:LysR family transcriptional regulator [Pseudomonadales bacterium]